MKVSVTDAKAQLAELVQRAEAGDEVILTEQGEPAVRLVPVRMRPSQEHLRAALEERRDAGARASAGPSAARSQDFPYDESGLPA